MTNDLLTIGLAVTQIIGTVIAVWYTVSSSLKKGLEGQIENLRLDLKEELTTLREIQKNQANQIRELEKQFNEHRVYVERAFSKKSETDEVKKEFAETKALLIALAQKLNLSEVK